MSTDALMGILAAAGVAVLFGWMWIASEIDKHRAARRAFARRRARLEREDYTRR